MSGTISPAAARALAETARQTLTSPRNERAPQRTGRRPSGSRLLIAKAPVGGIAARDGSNILTSEDCEIYYINSSDTLVNYKDAADANLEIAVFNPFGTAVSASAWILIEQEQASGRWIVTAEDC